MSNVEGHRLSNLSDSEVWSLFLAGNEHAFDYIYRMAFDRLYNYGHQFTPDSSLVEDAIQELFIDLRRRATHLTHTDKIMPYLFSAFRRKIIRMRDRARRSGEQHVLDSFSVSVSVEDEMITNDAEQEVIRKLESGLQAMPEKYREIIYYFYYERMAYSEIQEVLGFENVKSVRNLLYKALKALQKGLMMIFLLLLSKFGLMLSGSPRTSNNFS